MTQVVTPSQRKKQFINAGEPVREWARNHGFESDMPLVYRVLNGQSPALRGKAHRVAVALGIKPNVNQPVSQ